LSNPHLAYWLASDAKADFDKWDRYLFEFFKHKNYPTFRNGVFKHLEVLKKKPLNNLKVKKVSFGEEHYNKKVCISMIKL